MAAACKGEMNLAKQLLFATLNSYVKSRFYNKQLLNPLCVVQNILYHMQDAVKARQSDIKVKSNII